MFGGGIYDAASTAATYAEVLVRARTALAAGESVVLDASWSDADARQRAREVAEATASDLVELRCEAPPDVAAARMRERARRGGDPSDADALVAARMAEHAAP